MSGGMHLSEQYHNELNEVRAQIRNICGQGGKVVLWAANKICVDLLEGFELPRGVAIVDSNPEKKDYMQPVPVHEPHTIRDFVLSAKLVVINTPLFAEKIIRFIRDDLGRSLLPDELRVVKGLGWGQQPAQRDAVT